MEYSIQEKYFNQKLKMKSLLILVAIAIALSSCGNKEQKTNVTQVETPVAAPAQLTDAQKADGWKLLFDGQKKNGHLTSDAKGQGTPGDVEAWQTIARVPCRVKRYRGLGIDSL